MKSVLLLVNSGPWTANAQRAWQMAYALHGQGYPVTLFLIQDGVLAARQSEPALRNLPPEIVCYALMEDLELRGFAAPDLRAHIQMADYAQLIDLMEENPRVIGAL